MNNERHFIWATTLMVCMMMITIALYNAYSYRLLVDNGYEEQRVSTGTCSVWVKTTKENK